MPPVKTQHKRTAVGCWTCRRRRIKCDARRPSCLKCEKSKLKCEGYDVKLNWSSILCVKDGAMMELNLNSDSSNVFQRSNIELCRWWLYDYYNDIDNDLDKVDRGANHSGPFRSFKYKDPSIEFISRPFYLSRLAINTIVNKFDILNDIHFINSFIKLEFLPNLDLSNDIKLTLSEYFLNDDNSVESNLNFILLLSVIVIQLMKLNVTKEVINKIYNYFNKIDYYLIHFDEKIKNILKDSKIFDKFLIILVLKIFINSNLGIYQDFLFNLKKFNNNSLIYDYYKFFQSTNYFLNQSKYLLSDKYKKFYVDLLPDYNLLKFLSFKPHSNLPIEKKDNIDNNKKLFDYESRRIPSTNKQFKVKISLFDTPNDQVIRIPKYNNDDNNTKEEQNPPSFRILFDNNIDDDDNANEDNDNDDSDDYDNEENQYENLFKEFKRINNNEISVFGISSKLVYLYTELCHLINHRRIFNKIQQISRNWMRIISDFEDLLIRQIPKFIKLNNENNEIFYNFLIFSYFKYVKNFPLKYLHLNLLKFQKNDLNIGVLKFLSHNLLNEKSNNNNNEFIFNNNFNSKEFLKNLPKNDFEKFNDWDSNENEFFVV